jgi:hypothetical protein
LIRLLFHELQVAWRRATVFIGTAFATPWPFAAPPSSMQNKLNESKLQQGQIASDVINPKPT